MQPVKDQDQVARDRMLSQAQNFEKPPTASGEPKVKIHAGPMQTREFCAADYVVQAEPGVMPEDVLKEEFWTHRAQELKTWNRLEVRADDGTWMSEVMVLSTGRTWAKVRLLQHYDLTTADVDQTHAAAQDADYTVRWAGHTYKWSVIRNSDKQRVHEGAGDETAARKWLTEHLKAM